jgi:hypothetical protein
MGRRSASESGQQASVIESALAAMDADELRELVREMLLELDDRAHGRAICTLIDRAARNTSGWAPEAASDGSIAAIVAFAEAARRVGQADPSEVDGHLREGANAFLGKSYRSAFQIFRALLPPLGNGDIDLGQHEMLDEVLSVDLMASAAQYVVSVYITASPAQRAKAVRSAIDDVHGVHQFWEPLRELEKVAVEPLPGLDEFLPEWRVLVEASVAGERRNDWDRDEDRWLREVVRRIEGAEGLARVARSTGRADDLRAWCGLLADSRDWKSALLAYEEAARIVTDKDAQAEFLDGVALAAQELGRKDLAARLELAWRAEPTLTRLLRWLGSAGKKAAVRKRAAEALEGCPAAARRQRTLLQLILGDLDAAGKLLADAPGLGWSGGEHPGHLLFPLFCRLLMGDRSQDVHAFLEHPLGIDAFERLTADPGAPRLTTPSVDQILELAEVDGPADARSRSALIAAMRKAAEKRVAGVTENMRRRHYDHAAQLVAACVTADRGAETAGWVAGIRTEYRRYPALKSALDRHLQRA